MSGIHKKIGLVLGLVILVVFFIFSYSQEHASIGLMAGIASLMTIWWITEAVPIPVTALVPVALFPCFKIMTGKAVSSLYFNNMVFLFTGGFIIALAMKKCNLHRRIALYIISIIGSRPRRIVLGFMCATAFLSMWISNTATAVMMVPIAMSLIDVVNRKTDDLQSGFKNDNDKIHKNASDNFALTLMLGIAYAASIGGISTLIGTPANLVLTRIYEIQFPQENPISFASWMIMALPLSIVFLLIAWFILTVVMFPTADNIIFKGKDVLRYEREKLGEIRPAEKRVLIVFVATVMLWLFRGDISMTVNFRLITIPGWSSILGIAEHVDDGTIAITMAILLFLISSKEGDGKKLMDWETAVKLPWGILLLFGGGFALAGGFTESGLSQWIGERLHFLVQCSQGVLIGGIGLSSVKL